MTVPDRAEAAQTLLALDPPAWLLRHSAAVAEVAAFLAQRIVGRDAPLDGALVEAAALLHDVGKALPRREREIADDHARAGAEWLGKRGFPELSAAVAAHTATLLTDERLYPAWRATASLEERVVAYADKRAAQELVSLDVRFAEWRARHPEMAAELELGRQRAKELEREVCRLAGVRAHEVGRLGWATQLLEPGRATSRG